MNVNEHQVGGDHYKRPDGGEEHWDRAWRLGLDYWQAQVTKYVERCWKKGGVQDLEKARHFLDKYIELSRAAGRLGAVEADALMERTALEERLAAARVELEQHLEDDLRQQSVEDRRAGFGAEEERGDLAGPGVTGQSCGWIATHTESGRVLHFSLIKGWKIEEVAYDPTGTLGSNCVEVRGGGGGAGDFSVGTARGGGDGADPQPHGYVDQDR